MLPACVKGLGRVLRFTLWKTFNQGRKVKGWEGEGEVREGKVRAVDREVREEGKGGTGEQLYP